ncbi:MAG: D-alanyl-lipoteichoic acid biosynthesis protein DltD [Blautia sp.]|nr:D-alanyl-lipoteichoic acid biosynthesis protein DltD [Blautia sp.]
MKRLKAFGVALVLFALTVLCCHFGIRKMDRILDPKFAVLADEEKARLHLALYNSMESTYIPVFGSSEFQHGRDTIYHPQNVFAGNDFQPMLIGAGYYQCLSHAETLASMEEGMSLRKAVLILSPQWFRKTGVVDLAYASRFSETHYAAAIGNPRLSDDTKEYISKRTQKLLKVDPKTQEKAREYDAVLWKKTAEKIQNYKVNAWLKFLNEKERFEITRLCMQYGLSGGAAKEDVLQTGEAVMQEQDSESADEVALQENAEPDWEALQQQAEQEGDVENQNPFYIDQDAYERVEPLLPEKKDMNSDAVKGYQVSPEYDDLECFLQVCKELEIEPMLVILPVNGYYYDFTGFPKSARQAYYQNIRDVAAKFGVKTLDLADQEYTKYFFEDRVHLGKKGWLMVNEGIYSFYREDQTEA